MGVAAKHVRYTIAEYVRLERYSNVKHEYADGQILAMAGGTPEHAAMASNINAALVVQLRDRPCRVYTSDARVRVVATGLDTYPDITVVCGGEERDIDDDLALTNPVVLVEVLSPNTEEYDRGEKFDHYKLIASLRELVFVAHDEPHVEVWQRGAEDVWARHQDARRGGFARLTSIDCTLDVDEIYRDPFATVVP